MDFNQYPALVVRGKKFRLKIVVSSEAQTEDVLGSIDIAASLQSQFAEMSFEEEPDAETQIGMAILDKDVTFPVKYDLIVVGHPKYNTVTKKILEDANLLEKANLDEEEGRLLLLELEDYFALLVMGGSAKATLATARVLASSQDLNLRGKDIRTKILQENEILIRFSDGSEEKLILKTLDDEKNQTLADNLQVHFEEDSEYGHEPNLEKILSHTEDELFYNLGYVVEYHRYSDQAPPPVTHATSEEVSEIPGAAYAADRASKPKYLANQGKKVFEEIDRKLYELICHRFEYCTKAKSFRRAEDILEVAGPCVAVWLNVPHGVALFLVALVIKKGIDEFCGCVP